MILRTNVLHANAQLSRRHSQLERTKPGSDTDVPAAPNGIGLGGELSKNDQCGSQDTSNVHQHQSNPVTSEACSVHLVVVSESIQLQIRCNTDSQVQSLVLLPPGQASTWTKGCEEVCWRTGPCIAIGSLMVKVHAKLVRQAERRFDYLNGLSRVFFE